MFHERQSRQMCLVHALNNLLQKREFTSHSLDDICYSLNESRWLNPHRSVFGLGNYDVNVLMIALEQKNLSMMWFDVRTPLNKIILENVMAFIFNVPTRSIIPFYTGRHWFTVLKLQDGSFINLDSKLSNPEQVPNVLEYIKELFLSEEDNVQMMLVTKGSTENLIKKDSPPTTA